MKSNSLLIFFLALVLIPLSSAVSISQGTNIINTQLSYNFTIIADSTVNSFTTNATNSGDANTGVFFDVPTFLAINNTNATGNGKFNLTGMTNALVYNSTGSINCGGLKSGVCEVSIWASNSVCANDNFVLTESNDGTNCVPFNLSYSDTTTSRTYHVTSSLVDNTSIPINLTVPLGYKVTYIKVTPKGGSTYLASGSQIGTSVFIPSANLSYSSDSNEIELGYTTEQQSKVCNGFFDAGVSYGSFIVILIILSVVGVIFTFLLMGDGNLDLTFLIAGGIMIGAIVLSIGMVIINNINGC